MNLTKVRKSFGVQKNRIMEILISGVEKKILEIYCGKTSRKYDKNKELYRT